MALTLMDDIAHLKQELSLVEGLTVAENLCLGQWPRRNGMIGAGIVHPPFACFEKAIFGWCERYGV